MMGERKPWSFVNTEFDETQGQFSPDMRWVAYQSDESGRPEIHIRPFPPAPSAAGGVMASNGGGYQPRWRKDGKELFYFTGDGKLMAVDVTAGSTLKLAGPHMLFSTTIYGGGRTNEAHRSDMTADGRNFLITTVPTQRIAQPFTLL